MDVRAKKEGCAKQGENVGSWSNELEIKGRIFLVGCPRSGTTILQAAISANSAIATFHETNFFRQTIGQLDRRFGLRRTFGRHGLVQRGADLLSDIGISNWKRSRKELEKFLTGMSRYDLMSMYPENSYFISRNVHAFMNILDRLCLDDGKEIWLEKSPTHILYTEEVERYVAGPKFVHIIRDGKEVVGSLRDAALRYEAWRSRYSIGDLIDNYVRVWNTCFEISERYKNHSNHHLVHYNSFVKDAEGVLRRLCEFLEIDFEPGMLLSTGVDIATLARPIETWKTKVSEGIRPQKSKFQELFSAEEQSRIISSLASTDAY